MTPIVAFAAFFCVAADARPPRALSLDNFFDSDYAPLGGNVVLLQQRPNRISGTAMNISDGVVNVWLDNKLVAGDVKLRKPNASAPATWEAMLPAMPAGYNHTLTITATSPDHHQEPLNVSVGVNFGLVLLCSGQSNMVLHVGPFDFQADNGTAEAEASSRYTGRISLLKSASSRWRTVSKRTLPRFSAVCWYSGRHLFDSMGGTVPLGLMLGCVSGTPIEYWVRDAADVAACGNITGRCWNATVSPGTGLANLYRTDIQPFADAGLGISAMVWDQAESDVNCHPQQQQPPRLGGDSTYTCLQKALISGWRKAFTRPPPRPGALATAPPIPWVGVQLPGYVRGFFPAENGVFDMRLAQAAGVEGVPAAAIVPTYDLSCAPPYHCPWTPIHPPDKEDVGARIAQQLRRLVLHDPRVAMEEGPTAAMASVTAGAANTSVVSVKFDVTAKPLALHPTRNCTSCCAEGGSDFGVSVDGGENWVMANDPGHTEGPLVVQFAVNLTLNKTVKARVRYTAARGFPQCAVVDARGLPAFPFQMDVQRG